MLRIFCAFARSRFLRSWLVIANKLLDEVHVKDLGRQTRFDGWRNAQRLMVSNEVVVNGEQVEHRNVVLVPFAKSKGLSAVSTVALTNC